MAMTTLHTVNKSPYASSALTSCIDHCNPGDAILLIEDAVLAARASAPVAAKLAGLQVYALGPDLAARSIRPEEVASGLALVDYSGFVELAARHARSQAWL
jgi:tRNA 2-thiouridine synthesizing protein B